MLKLDGVDQSVVRKCRYSEGRLIRNHQLLILFLNKMIIMNFFIMKITWIFRRRTRLSRFRLVDLEQIYLWTGIFLSVNLEFRQNHSVFPLLTQCRNQLADVPILFILVHLVDKVAGNSFEGLKIGIVGQRIDHHSIFPVEVLEYCLDVAHFCLYVHEWVESLGVNLAHWRAVGLGLSGRWGL